MQILEGSHSSHSKKKEKKKVNHMVLISPPFYIQEMFQNSPHKKDVSFESRITSLNKCRP